MKILADASDFILKNKKMLLNLKATVPSTCEQLSSECVNLIKYYLEASTTGAFGSTKKLFNSIDKEQLEYGRRTIFGIGNILKMPIYWRIQEHGGRIPDRVAKSKKAMHFFAYGKDIFTKTASGFFVQAKNYFARGLNAASFVARKKLSEVMDRIMRG